MKIERFIVGNGQTNAYIIYDENNLEGAIIDPGANFKTLKKFIDEKKINLRYIILTHHHYDHIEAVEDLKKEYNPIITIHKKDVAGLKNPNINHSKKGAKKPISINADEILKENDIINIGDIKLKVVHTPGHTKGSISLIVENENIIFTGDTIFCDCIGRIDLVDSSEEMMIDSVLNKVSKWEDKIKVYPGHGNLADMKYVRANNDEYLYIIKNYS